MNLPVTVKTLNVGVSASGVKVTSCPFVNVRFRVGSSLSPVSERKKSASKPPVWMLNSRI